MHIASALAFAFVLASAVVVFRHCATTLALAIIQTEAALFFVRMTSLLSYLLTMGFLEGLVILRRVTGSEVC